MGGDAAALLPAATACQGGSLTQQKGSFSPEKEPFKRALNLVLPLAAPARQGGSFTGLFGWFRSLLQGALWLV